MDLAVSEIAARLGVPCEGEGTRRIRGLAGLCEAGENDITFAANPKYAPEVAVTRAGAVLVGLKWDRPSSAGALLRVPDPDKAFADVAAWFAPLPVIQPPGVHPTAVLAPSAELGLDVSIGPHVVVEPGARIGARSVLYAGCYVGHGVSIGDDCRLYPHVSIREYCRIGHRVILHNGVVIGSDGFGYNVDAQGVRTKIPQIGIVEIGDDVEIGANTTIDRARFGRTRIGKGTKIDNLVMIAHNVTIGDHAVLVAQVGVSGSAEIGAHAILAGQVGVVGHIKIGDGAIIGAQSGVPNDVPARAFVVGSPPLSRIEFARNMVNVSRIPKLKERIAALEKQVHALETRPSPSATGP